jgi:GH15 family glucan-1,4-alpha-glucosidase
MVPVVPIEEHGVIGDGRSVALVASNGTVDWLCWPRFDSDATFAALLDDATSGAWELRPTGNWRSSQAYVPETNLLITNFEQAGARVTVTDLMPVCTEKEARRMLVPEHELLRVVECQQGEAELSLSVRFAPGFGTQRLRVQRRGSNILCLETRSGAFFLRADQPLAWDGDEARATFTLRSGETARFSLIWSPEGPAVLPPLKEWASAAIERSVRFWRSWAQRTQYDGPYVEAVRRSALVLKLLQYPPSGALLAAATTSLPERFRGDLNWDYRFCWLRDAAFTARALYGLGFGDEADAFVFWLLHTTRLTQPRLAVLYDVYGNSPGAEVELSHLRGYGGARPVRVGNAAEHQLQLDIHGELIDGVCAYVDNGGELDRETRRMLKRFGAYVSKHWTQPDASIWEDRGPPRHYTHSKALCWAALDGLIRLNEQGVLPELDVAEARSARETIRRAVQRRAVIPETGSYASVFEGRDTDAALLLLPWYGFEPASSPRMRATLAHVQSELGTAGGLLYRNRELQAQGDGGFIACSFWGAELVADGAGPFAEAETWLRQILEHASPLGLYAEEVDALTGRALGNFPQAYSHVALINAALTLEEQRARRHREARHFTPAEASL